VSNITIIYGSGGGNTELVCEKVAEVLGAKNHKITLLKAKLTKPEDVGDFDVLILASPTYGHGQLETYFEKFFMSFQNADLKGKKCCTIGLGDMKYDSDYLIESANIIEEFYKEKEAEVIIRPLKIAKSPIPHLDGLVAKWAEELSNLI